MKAIDLEPKQELIFKVGEEPIKLELRRGLAEVYGTEMLANKTYTFSRGAKAAVFTYHGATVEMTGTPLKSHVSKTCDYMMCYLTIHRDLEKMRDEAERAANETAAKATKATTTTTTTCTTNPDNGSASQLQATNEDGTTREGGEQVQDVKYDLSKTPICLVCEPLDARNVGKSTLCRILLNYATRRGRAPIFVDLDPDQGQVGLPGAVGAVSIESPIDIEKGLALRSSLLMHFGHIKPSADNESKGGLYYEAVLESLAKIVHSKLEQDKKSYFSGVIINSSSWSDANDYKLLVDACKAFKANMVLVMDDEVLQDDLQKDLADSKAGASRVLNVPKTVEIYKTKASADVELRYSRIKEYFYGNQFESYNPMTSEVKFSVLKKLIYRVGNPLMLPDSLMPLGTKTQENQIKVSHFECDPSDLLHHILAISYCSLAEVMEEPERVLRTNLMGFICITSVRGENNELVSILTPQKLPNPMENVLLYSDIQYMDSLI